MVSPLSQTSRGALAKPVAPAQILTEQGTDGLAFVSNFLGSSGKASATRAELWPSQWGNLSATGSASAFLRQSLVDEVLTVS